MNARANRPSEIADIVAGHLRNGDLEGIVSMFYPECTICFPLDEPPKTGRAAVREIFGPFCEIRPVLVSTVSSELVNRDTALLQGEWRFEDADGNVLASGRSTEVAKRLADGSWGYFIDCPLGAPPP